MKILFIEPPFERFIRFQCEWFPMGLVSMATYLEKQGHKCHVYNAEHDNSMSYLDLEYYADNFHKYGRALENDSHPIWQEIKAVIADYSPEVLGLSIKTVKVPSAVKVAKLAKEVCPDVTIVVGGPHPTVCPEEMAASPFFDYVIKGEGEETMAELLNFMESGRHFKAIAGLAYEKDNMLCNGAVRPLIMNMDKLPVPNRKLLIDWEDYTPSQLGWLMTSRGCPYDCAYCSSKTMWTRKVRYYPLEHVLEEVGELKSEYGVSNLLFMDDSFTVNKRYVRSMCDAFIKKNLKMTWACLTRADLLDKNMISAMKAAGCTKMDIGIESGSPSVQKTINKGIDLNQVKEMALTLRDNKMFWAGFFMMGIPGETKSDILQTLKFMKEIKPDWVCFSIFTPYPGTALYERAKELGLIKEGSSMQYAHQSPDNCFSEKIPPDEFKELAKMMLKEFKEYNSSFNSLLCRALTKNYFRNPQLFFHDLKKGLSLMFPIGQKP